VMPGNGLKESREVLRKRHILRRVVSDFLYRSPKMLTQGDSKISRWNRRSIGNRPTKSHGAMRRSRGDALASVAAQRTFANSAPLGLLQPGSSRGFTSHCVCCVAWSDPLIKLTIDRGAGRPLHRNGPSPWSRKATLNYQ
jgi:hypothetical protein